jgi:hypothetical protein
MLLNTMFRKLSFNFRKVIFTLFVLSLSVILFSGQTFACPYTSVQARVQPDIQTPWSQELTINKGDQVRVGGFKNGSGYLADCCVSLQVIGPNGYVSYPANGSYITPPYSGNYTLKVTCDNLQDTAIIHVIGCPYSSIQARVQPNTQTPWTQELTINKGEQVRVGGFKNGSGYLADCCVSLQVTGPNGYVSNPANGSYITLQYPGNYTLKVTCDNLQDTAIIHVLECPYSSVQARVQPNVQTPWTQELTINKGDQVRVGGFKNGSGELADCCVSLQVTGPNGYVSNPANGSYITLQSSGDYSLKVTCGNLQDTAIIHVNECPYSSVQARVQPNEQTPWTQELTINKGEQVRVGGFKNGSGYLADCCVSLQVTGPNGYVSNPANGSFITLQYSGNYTLKVTCGSLQDSALIHVLDNAACPFNSVQARVQRDITYDWKKDLKINIGESFRVGAFNDHTGLLANCCVILTLSGPNNYVTYPQNGTYINPPYKGIYALKVSCGNLLDYALVYVMENKCQCSPIMAKVQARGSNQWKENLTIKKGQSFRVGALKNNQLAANCDVCLLVKGAGGYTSFPANGSYITPLYAGKYDLHVSCGKSSNSAQVNVTITQEEGNNIHLTQYYHSTYNTDGPISSLNCGPASWLCVLEFWVIWGMETTGQRQLLLYSHKMNRFAMRVH